jgi:predicted dehydrogenase
MEFGIPHAFDDYEAMLKLNGLDVVAITAPPYLHHPMTLAALEAGKHLLCEKPMATSLAEAEEMYARAQHVDVVTMINHEFRFLQAWRYLKALTQDGYLGELYTVNLTAFTSSWADPHRPAVWADPEQSPWNWLSQREKGGGVLGAMGSHVLDGLRWWFGDIGAVCAQLMTSVPEREDLDSGEMRTVTADDGFGIALRFRNGALGVVHVSYAVSGGTGFRLQAYGSEGTLILDQMMSPAWRLRAARRGETEARELAVPEEFQPDPEYQDHRLAAFVRLVDVLVEGIRSGQRVQPSFHDGLKVQRLMDAVALSDAEGRWVDVE